MKPISLIRLKAAECLQLIKPYKVAPGFIAVVVIVAIIGGFQIWRMNALTKAVETMLESSSSQLRLAILMKATARNCVVHIMATALAYDETDAELSEIDYDLERKKFRNYISILRNGSEKINIPHVELRSKSDKAIRSVESRWASLETATSKFLQSERTKSDKGRRESIGKMDLAYNRARADDVIRREILTRHDVVQAAVDDLLVLFNRRITETRTKIKVLRNGANTGFAAAVAAIVLMVLFVSWRSSFRAAMHRKTMTAMKDARDSALAASKTKSRFLTNVSHEVRTPLNGIMGMTEELLETELTEKQLECVNLIFRSTQALLSLINNVLDFSEIQDAPLQIETTCFDLHRTIRDVCNTVSLKAKEKGLGVKCSIHPAVPERVFNDPVRIRQLLMILADNAIKFTDTGFVLIRCVLENESDDDVVVRFNVSDTGVGICDADMERLYKEFSMLDDSETRRHGGMGLGLALSKAIVERLGGQIGVESGLGQGSTFWFTVALKKNLHSGQSNASTQISADFENCRALLVYKQEEIQYEIREHLEYWRCHVDVASTGSEAAEILVQAAVRNAPFDIVIVDIEVVELDWETLNRVIKDNPLLCNTKMILVADAGLQGVAMRSKALGFAAHLSKPIRHSLLHDCLARLLNKPGPAATDLVTAHCLPDESERHYKILIVEDNAVNQKVVMRILEKNGYLAKATSNGREALRALEASPYDLVLMDIQMPEMDGLEATRIIREGELPAIDKHIPIIAVTAHAMEGDRERMISAGMDDYVSKPLKPALLLDAIGRNLKAT